MKCRERARDRKRTDKTRSEKTKKTRMIAGRLRLRAGVYRDLKKRELGNEKLAQSTTGIASADDDAQKKQKQKPLRDRASTHI